MSLVDVATSCFNPPEFTHLSWLVVITQVQGRGTVSFGADCPRVTYVYDVDVVVESHYHVCTRAGFAVLELLRGAELGIHLL